MGNGEWGVGIREVSSHSPLPIPHSRPVSLRSYLDLHSAFFNALGQDDLQQSTLQLGRDSIGVNLLGKLKSPLEFAVSALQPVKIFALHIALPSPGASQNQGVIYNFYVKVGKRHSGHFGGQDEIRRSFVNIDRRRPGGVRLLNAESARPLNHLSQLLLKRRQVV